MIRLLHRSALVVLSFHLISCAKLETYQPEPIDSDAFVQVYLQRDLNDPDLHAFLQENAYQKRTAWDLQGLTLAGEFYSPELMVADSQVKEAEAALISAGVKPDTELELSFEHHKDQPGGVSPLTIGSIFTWVYEPQIKRDARKQSAQARISSAKISADLISWQVYDGVLDNYLDSYDALQKQKLIETEMENLSTSLGSLERAMELGQGADFEISRTRLELQQLRLNQSQEQGRYRQAISGLALAVGIPANDLRHTELSFNEFDQLPELDSPLLQLATLQKRALTERADVLKQLSDYAIAEAELFKAVAAQHPDIRLSPGFIFDQDDQLWVLASAFNLPNKARHQSRINETLVARETQAYRFHALQARVINEVNQAYVQYETALATLAEADHLIEDLKNYAAKLQRQYDLGYTSELTLLREKQQYLSALSSRHQIRMQAWHAFAAIEDALMTSLLYSP